MASSPLGAARQLSPSPPARDFAASHHRRRRRELLRDPRVKFCGYKHPHPLDNDILLRVQTAPGVAPAQSLVGAATRLRLESTLIKNKFDDEMRRIAEEKARLHDDY